MQRFTIEEAKEFGYQEVPYKKLGKSFGSRKSNHKHYYLPCVFEYSKLVLTKEHGFTLENVGLSLGQYCPVCGKRGYVRDDWYYRNDSGKKILLSQYESQLNSSTRTWPVFHLKNFFDKQVDLSELERGNRLEQNDIT